MKACRTCLLPEKVPHSDINNDGICSFCRADSSTSDTSTDQRLQYEADLEAALKLHKGQAEYDAIVCFSGGKDSVMLLHKLKEHYGLKILAFTTDINIPKVAWNNIKRSLAKLDIDHAIYRPSDRFYRKLFCHLLRNQEARGAVYTVSYVYAPLFEGDALRLATEKQVPLVLAGYSPGQPEPERMLYEFSQEFICESDWTPPALKLSGQFDEQELSRFWNPVKYAKSTQFPRYLAPFHAWEYSQEEVLKTVVELGLVQNKTHASPIHSNYPINWLLMYSDLIKFGYNPYAPEFSALIREGKANLQYWKYMAPIVDFMIKHKFSMGKNVSSSLKWLGLDEKELNITLPKGAYDPPLIANLAATPE